MKIILAPMEGVTDVVLRTLLTRVGGYDLCVTEFVRVTDHLLPEHVFYRYCPELHAGGVTPSGVPVHVQLLGGRAETLAANAARLAQMGAPGIDLNFGCPAKTVNRHDGGAALLQYPHRIAELVGAVRSAVPTEIPVTAKMRLGFEDDTLALENLRAVEAAGATWVTVHARTKAEGYRPPARWAALAPLREQVRIPIVANGEIWSEADYHTCRAQSGCESVMLGRGAIAAPDLARRLRGGGERLPWAQVTALFPDFVTLSRPISRSPQHLAARMKQWLKALAIHYPESLHAFEQLKRSKDPDAMLAALLAGSAQVQAGQGRDTATAPSESD